MALYLKELRKYFPGDEPSEPSLAGWVSAEMFSDGLRTIGTNVTRARLVAAVNSLTAYTGGLMAPIDWQAEHHDVGPVDCNVYRPGRRHRVRAGLRLVAYGVHMF